MKLSLLLACVAVTVLAGCEGQSGDKEKMEAVGETVKMQAAATKPAEAAKVPAAPAATGPALVDSVNPANEQEEAAHGQKGAESETGEFQDRTYRHALNGWFSYDLKVAPDQPNELLVTYWGSDQRSFDILIDGQKLVTENIDNDHPDQFFEKHYTLTPAMTKGKQKVTVRFENPTSYAGGVFGIRVMRPGAATMPAK